VTTAVEASDATAIPILEFGRAWMSSPDVQARAADLGLAPGFSFWVNGRAGALGDVGSDVAAAAIGFMAPDLVREHWDSRPSDVTPRRAAMEYAAVAAAWGREAVADVPVPDLERIAELGYRVADASLPSCGALFAGWRALDRPDDPAGNATHALQVLREMRGGAHLSAVAAAGLTPHHAIISFTADPVRGGVRGAERFGWTAPHPEPDEAAKARAEEMTTIAACGGFEALSEAERSEFVELVLAAREAIG
jgi:hypothetical protein